MLVAVKGDRLAQASEVNAGRVEIGEEPAPGWNRGRLALHKLQMHQPVVVSSIHGQGALATCGPRTTNARCRRTGTNSPTHARAAAAVDEPAVAAACDLNHSPLVIIHFRKVSPEAGKAVLGGELLICDVARSFRDHVARCSDMMSPAWASCWCLVFGEKRAAGQSFAAGLGRVRRRLSPARSMRWALWTSRSRMASA